MEPLGNNPGPPGQALDFDIRGLGRRLPKAEAPEGWIRKIERRREGKVWVGFFHLWTTDAQGRRVRTKKKRCSERLRRQSTRRSRSWRITSANTPAGSPNKAIRSPRSVSFGRPSAR